MSPVIHCSLQRRDRDRVLHGSESGIIERDPSGTYSEAHVPVSHDEQFLLTQHLQHRPLEVGGDTDADGLPRKGGVSKLRSRLSRWYLGHEIAKPTAAEIEAAHHHDDDHAAVGPGSTPPRELH